MKNLKEKAITLVALVITIVIMLILAGVTINIALSENGLFYRAKNAADRYKVAQTNEQDLLTNLEKELDEYTPKSLVTTVTTINHGNIYARDKLGNSITVPGGFKVVAGETVEDGIVIEDEAGNQFVWIPVSNIDGDNNASTTPNAKDLIIKNDKSKVEITLGRYEFSTSDGKETLRQSGANRSDSSETTTIGSYYYENTNEEGRPNGGVGAKDLDKFVTSVEVNHGYYLARYEASFGSGDSIDKYKPFVKPSNYNSIDSMDYTPETLWNFITQADASKVCQNMYSSGEEASYVESDLVNSYAWDTAIVYIQAMKNNNYANQGREDNVSLKNTGDIEDTVCNIYDMAGNLSEWTTEYSTYTGSNNNPCVRRGSNYNSSSYYTVYRHSNSTTYDSSYVGFRPLLYLK